MENSTPKQIAECVLENPEPDETGQDEVYDLAKSHQDLLAALNELVTANYGQPKAVNVPALDNARAAIKQAEQGVLA